MKFYKIQEIVTLINNYDKDIVLCGCSYRTREILKIYNIKNKNIYILDNNKDLYNKQCSQLPIIDIKYIKKLNNPLCIIVGFHINNFYNQLLSNGFLNIIIEKQNHLTKYQQMSQLIPSNTHVYIDIPNFQTELELNSHVFIKKLITRLLLLNISITTQPTFSKASDIKYNSKIQKNDFLFSYHTIGNKIDNLIRYKDGYLSNTITFDTNGYSGWSSLVSENIDLLLAEIQYKKVNQYFNQFSSKYIKNNKSKYLQPSNEDFIFPNKDFIFFPLQTINDTVMQHSYFQPLKLIEKIIKILKKKDIPLVIKKHPKCNNPDLDILLNTNLKKGNLILFNGSIHDAISKATTIYTINSGVGFEALLHLKPIITFGKSDYMSMTKNVNNLETIQENPFYTLDKNRRIRIKKFIYYYNKHKTIFLNKNKSIDKILESLIINKGKYQND